MRFTRKNRLADRRAIAGVFDGAQLKVQNRSGLMLARRNALGTNRLVLIVGKKNIRRAVDRNRVKRLLREAFRCSPLSLPEDTFDIVFVARKGALESLWKSQQYCDLNKLWVKLKYRIE